MKDKKLHQFREKVTDIQIMCHKNLNRVIELMVKYEDKDLKFNLGRLAKLNVLLEKLCEYCASSCCNSDSVSEYAHMELELKCSQIVEVCKNLKKLLPKDKHEYIRCEQFVKICGIKQTKMSKKTY